MEPTSRFEQYARITVMALLVIGAFLVLKPFLAAILFAIVLCLSTWPAFAWLRAKWGGRESLTALVLVLALLVVIALPIALTAQSLVVNSGAVIDKVRELLEQRESINLPSFVVELPLVGASIDAYWQQLTASREELAALARKLVDPARRFLVALGGAVFEGLLQVLIAIFVAFFLYRDGDRAGAMFRTAVGRLAGSDQGDQLLSTAQGAVRGVVYGLVGTAAAQAFVALIGFVIAGVPGAFLLAALTFILSLVPMGPVLVWGGAAAWLYTQGQPGWAIFMVIYGVAVISSVDNFVKPILMSRAGGLSMLLVVLGVFGGAIAFGVVGLFVGPVLLSVCWSLFRAWVDAHRVEATPDAIPPAV